MSSLPHSAKGTLQLHVVQARQLARHNRGGTHSISSSFSVSFHTGSLRSGCIPATAPNPILTSSGDTAVWNAERELPFLNTEHVLWIRLDLHDESSSKKKGVSSPSNSSFAPFGEARLAVMEYESGVFHDVWLSFRRPLCYEYVPNLAHDSWLSGQIHVRFMYQPASSSSSGSSTPQSSAISDQSILASTKPSLGPFVHHLLASRGYWIHVFLAFLDSKEGEKIVGGDSSQRFTSLLQALLLLLSHTKFSLLLHVVESAIQRELKFLAEQQGGRVDAVWASNLFRRNSVAARLLGMFCLQQAPAPAPTPSLLSTFAAAATSPFHSSSPTLEWKREGVGKRFLVQLLSPFVQQIVKDCATDEKNSTTVGAGASPNPYEIDPARLGGDTARMERNQEYLIQQCQKLLNAVLASTASFERPNDLLHPDELPPSSSDPSFSSARIPTNIRYLARSLNRCVSEFVEQTPSGHYTIVSRHSVDDSALSVAYHESEAGSNGASVDDANSPPHSPKTSVASRAQVAHESSHNSLASLFFLRFLCPALVTPMHYGLLSRPPSPAASRAFILLAKALQSLVNSAGSVMSAAAADLKASATPPRPEQNSQLRVSTKSLAASAPSPTSTLLEVGGGVAAFGSPSLFDVDRSRSPSPPSTDASPAPSPTRQTFHAVKSAAAARLFKESYMECFYPFINRNLPRVSEFLERLATIDPIDLETNPGIEESITPSPLSPLAFPPAASVASFTSSGAQQSAVASAFQNLEGLEKDFENAEKKEYEKAVLLLANFFRANSSGLITQAEKMLLQHELTLPRNTPGQVYSAQGAVHELTKPRASDLGRHSQGSGTPHIVDPATPSSTVSSPLHSASVLAAGSSPLSPSSRDPQPPNSRAFLTGFRSMLEGLQLTTAEGGAASDTLNARRNIEAAAHTPTHSNLSSPAATPTNAFAAAASSSLKFLSRFLPAGNKSNDKEKEKEKERIRLENEKKGAFHPPIPLEDSSSSAAAPPPPPSAASSAFQAAASSSSSSGEHGNHSEEAFQLFKQTSVEIQLRLSSQLEESEERFAALQKAYAELETQCFAKDDEIAQLRAQLLQQRNGSNGVAATTSDPSAGSTPLLTPTRTSATSAVESELPARSHLRIEADEDD